MGLVITKWQERRRKVWLKVKRESWLGIGNKDKESEETGTLLLKV